MSRKVCVLASGGIDSAVLVAELLRDGREVHPLYVRFGFRWEDVEILWLKRFLAAARRRIGTGRLMPVTVVAVTISGLPARHWSRRGARVPGARASWDSVYLPGRNLLLLSQAGLFCALRGIPVIAQGILKGNPFQDARPRFQREMEKAFAAGLGARIKIIEPYARLTKREVARRVPGLPLELTFSCIHPRGARHCGRCTKCHERGFVLSA